MTIGLIVALFSVAVVLFFVVMTTRLETSDERSASRRRDKGILREVLTGLVVGAAVPAIVLLSILLLSLADWGKVLSLG